MNTYLLVLFLVLTFALCMYGVYIYRIYKKLKYKYETWWPVKHRLDENGYFQYSVDGKTWTYIFGFTKDFNYGDYVGPALNYIHFDLDEKDEYLHWCNMLYTMQKCHEFNKRALDLYFESIKKYLKDNN